MDLKRLRCFIAVAEQEHFGRAAEWLDTTQPAVSQHIAALEAELGVLLFERRRPRVRLTPAGAEYLAGVGPLVLELDRCAERARGAHDGTRGILSVGLNGSLMQRHFPALVQELRATSPDVAIVPTVLGNPDLINALREGRIDLALTSQEDPEGEFDSEPLWSTSWRVAIAANHRLADDAEIRLADMRDEVLIFHPHLGSLATNDELRSLCREQGYTPYKIQEVPLSHDLQTLIGFVACGFGFALLPAPYEFSSQPTVRFKRIAGTTRRRQFYARFRKGRNNALIRNALAVARSIEEPFLD